MGSGDKVWTETKHPASTSSLLASLHHLRETNPKAVRSTVHHYPASLYAHDETHNAGPSSHNTEPNVEHAAARDRRITSWKMTEHIYRRHDNPFPTLARGLFTEEIEEGNEVPEQVATVEGNWEEDQTRERIVARGYDKFFNIDEVEWTEWANMEHHSDPPYFLTLKSNGCLILVSALDPTHLMIASKHSLGTSTEGQADDKGGKADSANGIAVDMQNLKLSDRAKTDGADDDGEEQEASSVAHAEMGRRWVRKTLEASNKSEAKLAARLWERNLTAVLELCDDSFEEHVLATPAHWTGLHLHGLNYNTPHFSTIPPAEVSAFAKEFGFIPTKYIQLNTLDEVKSLTRKVEQEGTWEGDQIEGFVVRSLVSKTSAAHNQPGRPPYRPGAPFFFKVKFEEPYLLYRQWRELTRVMLPLRDLYKSSKDDPVGAGGKGKGKHVTTTNDDAIEAIWKKVRSKTSRQEVAVYSDWCAETMKAVPSLFDDYDRGVVRVRERFLAWTQGDGKVSWKQAKEGKYRLKSNKAEKAIQAAQARAGNGVVESEQERAQKPKKWLLVPIAVPGCGKTLLGVALGELFGFGHTQSDDVTTAKTAPTFLRNIVALFKDHEAVYADRNNHITKHYDELAKLSSDKSLRSFNLQLVGIAWDVATPPYHRTLRLCSERVVQRGDNHRTLRPDRSNVADHESVVGQFIRNWTMPDEDTFDPLIWLDIEDDPRTCLNKVIDHLVPLMGLTRPSGTAIEDALEAAAAYRITGPYKEPTVKQGKPPRYYAIAPEINLPNLMSKIFEQLEDRSSAKTLHDTLRDTNRVAFNPHITLVHESEIAKENESNVSTGEAQQLWTQCQALATEARLYGFEISHLVWDDRVMCLAISPMKCQSNGAVGAATDSTPAGDLSSLLSPELVRQLHITVGTRSENIRPHEAIAIVLAMRSTTARDAAATEVGEVEKAAGKVRWIPLEGMKGEGRIKGMN